jgi:hypothetical protein
MTFEAMVKMAFYLSVIMLSIVLTLHVLGAL